MAARRHCCGALIGIGLLSAWHRSLSGAVGFTTAGQPVEPPELLAAATESSHFLAAPRGGRGRLGLGPAATPDAARGPEHDLSFSSSGTLWWSLVGVSLAGATLGARRRECNVLLRWRARGIRRFKWKYGGDGPPKTPEWLTRERQPGEMSAGGHVVPPWLTLQKWEAFTAGDRARSVRWYMQYFDENGEPAFKRSRLYFIKDAVNILLGMNERAPLKFDATVEAIMQMNLDPKYPDQQIRCSIGLPHGTGKKVRVAVFCPPEEEEEVMGLGATICGTQLAKEIGEEKIMFDVLLAKPQMMPRLAKLGKILGPRRLMPSPKSGTVVTDYAEAIKNFQGGTLELRTDKRSMIHCPVGKLSFGSEKLNENFKALLQGLADKAPPGAKSTFFKKVWIGSTMSPTIRIRVAEYPKIVIEDEDD